MRFRDLAQEMRSKGPAALVVVAAADEAVVSAVARAVSDGIARPVLIGDAALISHLAAERGIDASSWELVDEPTPEAAAEIGMGLVRSGRADAVMKGAIPTPDFVRVGLKAGLRRRGRLLSHIAFLDHPRFGRLIGLTDGGIVPVPTLEQLAKILANAVEAMGVLSVHRPKVAGLSSTEIPDPAVPSSLNMARLKEMAAAGGELEGAYDFDGPLDLFSALDPRAAEIKGLSGPVAGRADILLCPDVVSGNLMAKSMMLLAEGLRSGGCVVGGTVPIVLLSRASSADDKYCSILAALACGRRLASQGPPQEPGEKTPASGCLG